MKPASEVTACICDYGTFLSVADKLAESYARCYYHSPFETEYQDVRDCIIGTGLEKVRRLDDMLDPATLAEIDLFIFPDIGFGGLQKHLRSLGKAVWGHMGATELELYRTYFLEVIEQAGLPIIHSETIVGVTALAKHLKEHDDLWIKINRFRGNMETWHHDTYVSSVRMLDSLAVIFGGVKEEIVFVVQDKIASDMEIGYDGWCIDGQYPARSFQGYEKKNQLYLGSLLEAADLPDEIRFVNSAMAPVLERYGYRDWWATEIRVADGVPYFIDPTPRMPGQTGEHQLETCVNLAEVLWQGANGISIEPVFAWKFAAEATLHYTLKSKDPEITNEWKTLEIPDEARQWLKLYRYCERDGQFHCPAKETDEVGVVLGVGDSVEESITHLKDNFSLIEHLPLEIEMAGFASLLDSIKEAEGQGLSFGGKIPKPESILKKVA